MILCFKDASSRARTNDILKSAAAPHIGSFNAPVTVVVFSDFQCPYCQELEAVLKNRVLPAEQEIVNLQVRQLPLPSHPLARLAAETAMCALTQRHEAYWKVHGFLFRHQESIGEFVGPGNVPRLTAAIEGLDAHAFSECLSSQTGGKKVHQDLELATALGIAQTPTLFINGYRVLGVPDSVELRHLIEQAARGTIPPQPATPESR